ncbi:MAG: gp16 family protein [Rhabdaerophilum sp.]
MKPAFDPRKRLIAQIHIAKAQLGLGEAEYRDLLTAATGKASSALMNADELGRVIEALVKAGFKPAFKGAPDGKKSARKVVRLIFGLWTELHRRGLIETGSRQALFAFVKRQADVDHPDWLDNKQASAVVEALKAMLNRGKAA